MGRVTGHYFWKKGLITVDNIKQSLVYHVKCKLVSLLEDNLF